MSDGVPIKIDLYQIASLDAIIIRYLTPLSADAILDEMPFILKGRFSFGSKKYWTLQGLGLKEATNAKSKKEVEQGDLIYNPKTDEIIIILETMEMPNKVNKIGEIKSNLDLVINARNGLNTKISKA